MHTSTEKHGENRKEKGSVRAKEQTVITELLEYPDKPGATPSKKLFPIHNYPDVIVSRFICLRVQNI